MKDDKSNLDKLRELTPRLSTLKKDAIPDLDPYLVQYSARPGMVIAKGLLKKKEVSVLEAELKEGGFVENHNHNCHEWVIVCKGEITVIDDKGTNTYKVGQCWYGAPGVAHKTIANVDSDVIGITVPMEEAYPNVRQP
jgi:quercetin dioxygenase-like cupin family protein